mgnify:CR=1 FL=1
MDTSYYNRFGAEELTRRLSSETLLAQGPMGSVLLSEYDAADIPPAFWNLAEPQTVSRIHRLYVAAGAQVLITNTFQASSYALKHDQIAPSVAEVNRGAVDDARQAHPQLLLGSMGPIGIEWFAEDSAEFREIRGIAREQAHALLNAGVDGLLIETVTSIRNLQPMLAGARDAADGMPVLVSFVVDDKGDLLGDGLNIEAAVLYAEKHGANSVGVNCCSLAAANAAVPRMVASATRCVPTWAIRSRLRMAPYGTRTPKLSRAHASNGDMPVPQWWAVAVEPRQSLRQRWPRRSIYKGQNRSIRGGFIACMSSAAFAQMVNAGAGRLPSVYRGYTSCVP